MPPKKDAFADIFQSASSTASSTSLNRKTNLSDLQKQRNGGSSFNGSTGSNGSNGSVNNGSNWNEFDIFSSPSPMSNTSRAETPANDPFSIFDSSTKQPTPTPQPLESRPVQSSSMNLLDDEFTDAFHEPEPEPEVQTKLRSESLPREHVDRVKSPVNKRHIQQSSDKVDRTNPPKTNTDERDEVVAQLLDIGFPVDVSNKAIDEVGLDLQACVNFIMGGSRPSSESKSKGASRVQSPKEDLGSTINDLSSDLFSKASIFFNKSRETVIKNIEQFQNSREPNKSMPAWMRNQEKYKSQASERNPNGEAYEDYGDDEDNIDQEAIRSFMESQRLKDKERNKNRYDNFKTMAKESISSTRSQSNSPNKVDLPIRGSSQPNSFPRESIPQRNELVPERREPVPQKSVSPVKAKPIRQPQPVHEEVDLLGLGSMSRAEKFKAEQSNDTTYVSSSRRRRPGNVSRKTTKEPLNEFLKSDYDTGKERASKSFTNGDYDDACINYTKCLNALPPTHELRVVINSNLAITYIKLGNYKGAKDHCEQGLELISKEEINDPEYLINDKPIKSWYTKLLSRKAESLEMIEAFKLSLECYTELVQLGVNDKKTMDAKRRVGNIVNPPPKPKPQPKPAVKSTPINHDNLKRVQAQNKNLQEREQQKYLLHDKVQSKVFAWSNGKEDNLRTLLIGLPDILPISLGFPFLTTKKISLNDIMLPKKVKINYMKVISAIHPDKLSSLNLGVEEEMLCQAVFITLNKSWDLFKESNGIN